MNLLVTGGAGFIGSNFIRHILKTYPSYTVINVDRMSYAAHPETERELARLGGDRYHFVQFDISDPRFEKFVTTKKMDALINFAAETHVDRSILDPDAFFRTNIQGVQTILNGIRKVEGVRYIQISTDEVYGSLLPDAPSSIETSPLDPNSPYSASKASADLLALANQRTFNLDILVTRCSNNFGPYQFPEKLIPLVIANAMEDRRIPIYGDGRQVRDWIYVEDHCRAIDRVLHHGKKGSIYNIGGGEEITNLKTVDTILAILGKPASLMEHVRDRPAHDRRYSLNTQKIRQELGWKPEASFQQAMQETVKWYLSRKDWWSGLRDRHYFEYYEKNYRPKMGEESRA